MSYKLCVDSDKRRRPAVDMGMPKWVFVRSFKQMTEYIKENGCPEQMVVGDIEEDNKSRMDVAKWLVNRDKRNKGFMSNYFIFTTNPVDEEPITCVMEYIIARMKNDGKS